MNDLPQIDPQRLALPRQPHLPRAQTHRLHLQALLPPHLLGTHLLHHQPAPRLAAAPIDARIIHYAAHDLLAARHLARPPHRPLAAQKVVPHGYAPRLRPHMDLRLAVQHHRHGPVTAPQGLIALRHQRAMVHPLRPPHPLERAVLVNRPQRPPLFQQRARIPFACLDRMQPGLAHPPQGQHDVRMMVVGTGVLAPDRLMDGNIRRHAPVDEGFLHEV